MGKDNRKLYVATLGIAAAGFIADRVFSGGGLGPESATAAPSEIVAATSAVPELDPTEEPPQGDGLAAILRDAGEGFDPLEVQRVDAFKPFAVATAPAEAAGDGEPVPVPEGPGAVFLRKHRLNALMHAHGGGRVVVDGHRMVIGQTLDGFTLTSVRSRSAVFERDGLSVELCLPTPAGMQKNESSR